MNTKVKAEIISLARATPTREVCGFIVFAHPAVLVHPCENITQDEAGQEGTFEIDPQEYIAASGHGKVVGLYHSHPKGTAAFSDEDLKVGRELEIPSYVYAVEDSSWASYIPPTYQVSLTGTPFAWGQADCFETVRIYYRQKLGVYIGDYDRDETFKAANPDAITQHIADEGFVNLGDNPAVINIHDVLLFETPGHRYPHHLAVYLGGNRILHHPYGALSRIDDLEGTLLKRLLGVLRYEGKASLSPLP